MTARVDINGSVGDRWAAHHCSAQSTMVPSLCVEKAITSCSASLSRLTHCTYSRSPPAKWNTSRRSAVWWCAAMVTALLRKASSRRRVQMVPKSKVADSLNTLGSGLNRMRVPLRGAPLEVTACFSRGVTCNEGTGLKAPVELRSGGSLQTPVFQDLEPSRNPY